MKVGMRKIGVFGGTFNPVHNGHLRVVLEAYDYLGLDEVLMVPSGFSYMKDEAEIADSGCRLEMVKLAVKDYPYIIVSDMEIIRGGASYTYETIAGLKEFYPLDKLYFIIGADNLYSMEKWKNADFIFQNVIIAVRLRDASEEADLRRQADYLKERFAAVVCFLPGDKIFISSRLIRERVKEGMDVGDLVPAGVDEFIGREGLYL